MNKKDAKEEVLKWGLAYGFRTEELDKVTTVGNKLGADLPDDIPENINDTEINRINSMTTDGDFFLQFNRKGDNVSFEFVGERFDDTVEDLETNELEQFGRELKEKQGELRETSNNIYQSVLDSIEQTGAEPSSENGINVSTTVIDEGTVEEISRYLEQNFDPDISIDNEVSIDGEDITNSLKNEIDVSLSDEYSEELIADIDEVVESYANSIETKVDNLTETLESHQKFTEERFEDLEEDHEEIYQVLQELEGYNFSENEINSLAASIAANLDDGAVNVNSYPSVDQSTLETAFDNANLNINSDVNFDESDYEAIASKVVNKLDGSGDGESIDADRDDTYGRGFANKADSDEKSRRGYLRDAGIGLSALGGLIGGGAGIKYLLSDVAENGDSSGNNGGSTGNDGTLTPSDGGNQEPETGFMTGEWNDWESVNNCFTDEQEDILYENLVENREYDSLDELSYRFTEDGSQYDVKFKDESGKELTAKFNDQNLSCEVR